MPLLDQTGHIIEVQQVVHVRLDGMFAAVVKAVLENPIVVPGQQPVPPQVELHVIIKMPARSGVCDCYIVEEAPRAKEGLVH